MTRIKLTLNEFEKEWCMGGMGDGLCNGGLSELFVIPKGTKEINLCVSEGDSKEAYPVYLDDWGNVVVTYEGGKHYYYILSMVHERLEKMFGLNKTFYVSVEV